VHGQVNAIENLGLALESRHAMGIGGEDAYDECPLRASRTLRRQARTAQQLLEAWVGAQRVEDRVDI
jgi:hypothetical protein